MFNDASPTHAGSPRPFALAPIAAALLSLTLAACAGSPSEAEPHGAKSHKVPQEIDPTMPAPTSPPSSATAPDMPATDTAAQACNADAAQSFVGKPATEANVAAARQAAAPNGSVRVIAPGQAVTMDFRPDRLNIDVDAQRVIVKLRCG